MSRLKPIVVYINPEQVLEEENKTIIRVEGGDAAFLRQHKINSKETIICRTYSGVEYKARLFRKTDSGFALNVFETVPAPKKPFQSLRLLLGLGEAKDFSASLQIAAELDVSDVQPIITERTERKLVDDFDLDEQQQFVADCLRQCERTEPMALHEPTQFADFCARSKATDDKNTLQLLAWEGAFYDVAQQCPVAKPEQNFAFFLGPKGGITLFEKSQLELLGFRAVGLFPKIVGVEVAVVLAINYCWGLRAPNNADPRRTRVEPQRSAT